MPFIIYGRTKCAISGQVINEGDNCLAFPPLPFENDDPARICYEACVLREAFDAWEYKGSVKTKLLEYWQLMVGESAQVLFEDEDYLIFLDGVEHKIVWMLRQLVFRFDFFRKDWNAICTALVASDFSEFSLQIYPFTRLALRKTPQGIKLQEFRESSRHCVMLTEQEWAAFQEALRKANQALMRLEGRYP